MRRLAPLLAIALLLCACGDQRDLHTTRWPNDRLREQGPQHPDPNGNGARYGEWREWYDDGALESQGTYRDGKRDGDWTLWFANGQKYQQGRYAHGVQVGAWRTWYEGGGLASEGAYREGRRNGRWREWDESGRLLLDARYRDGVVAER